MASKWHPMVILITFFGRGCGSHAENGIASKISMKPLANSSILYEEGKNGNPVCRTHYIQLRKLFALSVLPQPSKVYKLL